MIKKLHRLLTWLKRKQIEARPTRTISQYLKKQEELDEIYAHKHS